MPTGDASDLTRAALEVLETAGGPGPAPAAAWAPGRCTLVGEHVDYAGGHVLCVAVDLGIAAAVRRSGTARYLAASGGTVVTRDAADPAGDLGDRVLAPVVALRARGVPVPAVEVGIAATLPAGAGLASSAALMVATATAILRLLGAGMSAARPRRGCALRGARRARDPLRSARSARRHRRPGWWCVAARLRHRRRGRRWRGPGRTRCSWGATPACTTMSVAWNTGAAARRPRQVSRRSVSRAARS